METEMLIVCMELELGLVLIEHDNRDEALSILAALEDGPSPVVVADGGEVVDVKHYEIQPLSAVVGRFLCATWLSGQPVCQDLFDALPLPVLRAAVEHRAGECESAAADLSKRLTDYQRELLRRSAITLRDALFLREQRDRIAADLADMERIGAMTVEPDAAPPS
jgi:hypothetical protein